MRFSNFFPFRKPCSTGIDIVENSRFVPLKDERGHAFLKKVFSEAELDYCFSFEDPVPHLAGIFSAKEAVSKALGVREYPFAEVVISHDGEGKPFAFHKGKKLSVSVSISHSSTVSAAIAIA